MCDDGENYAGCNITQLQPYGIYNGTYSGTDIDKEEQKLRNDQCIRQV